MQEVIKGILFFHGEDEYIPDSHLYIIGKPKSKDLSIIDPGLVGKGKRKLERIKEANIELNDIKRIILTHTHLDHIGCTREFMEAIPNLKLWVHESEAEFLETGDERIVYGSEMFAGMIGYQYNLKRGDFKFSVDKKLKKGDILEIGGFSFEVIHVPGHSMGSIALFDKENKVLISGDTVYADYGIGRVDLFSADPAEMKKSLYKLGELNSEILLPGHNRILLSGAKEAINETTKQWIPYL